MSLFEVEAYQRPSFDTINWKETKTAVGIFLVQYKIARERVGLPVFPKRTGSYHLLNEEQQHIATSIELAEVEPYQKEFLRFNQLFILGYSAIMHPYKSDVTDRRRTVFMLRYVYGLSIEAISEQIYYQKNCIIEDSKISLIAFSQALSIIQTNV